LDWFIDHGNGKKMYFDENGWPSVTSSGVQPNSPDAVANVQNEHVSTPFPPLGCTTNLKAQDYYVLLDKHCSDLKTTVGGGVGWFAHIYSDEQVCPIL
jgi:hypothetical protein